MGHGNAKAREAQITRVAVPAEFERTVTPPAADERWHITAKNWYNSLAQSGQSLLYEPSDWATAWVIAESLSRDMGRRFLGFSTVTGEAEYGYTGLNGSSLSAYLKAMSMLLVTEADRRRAGVKLMRAEATEEVPEEPSAEEIMAARARGELV